MVDVPHKDQIDEPCVSAPGDVTSEIYSPQIAQPFGNPLYDDVQAKVFLHDAVDLIIQRMFGVHFEQFAVPLLLGPEHVGFFETVELKPDRVGGLTELTFQSAKMGRVVRVEKELQQELDAGFGSDEGIDQNGLMRKCDKEDKGLSARLRSYPLFL